MDISSGAIKVKSDGIDFGDAALDVFYSEHHRGRKVIGFVVPNRFVVIPLILQTAGTVSIAQARTKLQQKVGLLQDEGGWFSRTTSGGGTVFADVVSALLHLPDSWMQSNRSVEPDAVLTLECIPDFYGAEVTLGDHVETSAAELVFTESGIKGDYPGRVRMVVDNDQATDQLGLIWGFRSRYYDSAATAAPRYEAEALTPMDLATKTALAGASGGTVVNHASLASSWTPVMNTNMAGTAFLTHVGTYKVLARMYSTSGTAVSARLVWDVGDLVSPAENTLWQVPGASAYYIADLGQVRLDKVPVGNHRWQGQIQARGLAGGENISVDKVWLVNADDGMGMLSAPVVAQATSTASFGPKSGATFADDATVGTVAWTNPGNAAASDDVYATATSSSSVNTHYLKATNFGFLIPAGATINGIQVDVERRTSVTAALLDNSVKIVKGGTISGTEKKNVIDVWSTTDRYSTYGGASDLWGVALTPADVNASTFGVAMSAQIVTGVSTTASIDHIRITVYYTPAVVPGSDAVIYANRTAQLTDQGMFRLDVGGTAYGPVSQVIGDLPRIPPSGLENRTTEIFIKGSRGDLNALPDGGIDDISCQLAYRPSWIFSPEQ